MHHHVYQSVIALIVFEPASSCFRAHVFSLLLGLKTFGPFIIMILEMIRYDIYCFSVVFMVMLMGFNLAIYHTTAANGVQGFGAFASHMQQLLILGFTGEPPAAYDNTTGLTFVLAIVLLLVYAVIMVILLMNLLIAMMNNTYTTILGVSLKRWYVERCNMMVSYEAEFTKEQMHEKRRKYGVPLDHDKRTVSASDDLFLPVTIFNEKWKDTEVVDEESESFSDPQGPSPRAWPAPQAPTQWRTVRTETFGSARSITRECRLKSKSTETLQTQCSGRSIVQRRSVVDATVIASPSSTCRVDVNNLPPCFPA